MLKTFYAPLAFKNAPNEITIKLFSFNCMIDYFII